MKSLLIPAVWALLLLVLYLYFSGWQILEEGVPKRAWLWICIIGFVVRLVPSLLLPSGSNYDIQSYELVAEQLLLGQDVYSAPGLEARHPYLPFQMFWMAIAMQVSESMQLPFANIVRLAPIFADAGIIFLIILMVRRFAAPNVALHAGLLYALNPIPIFVSAYHGQFDAIPALFLLAAYFVLSKHPFLASGLLGFGILNKSWPVLALPSMLRVIRSWKRRLLFLAIVIAIPAIVVLIYAAFFDADFFIIIRRATGYNRGIGVWGYTYLLRLAAIASPIFEGVYHFILIYGRYITLGLLGMIWLVRARWELPVAGFLTILVSFFAVTHAFAIQYLMWPVAFAIVEQDQRWLYRYTLAAFSYMFLVYMTVILDFNIDNLIPWPEADLYIIILASVPTWLIALGWTWERVFGFNVKKGQSD